MIFSRMEQRALVIDHLFYINILKVVSISKEGFRIGILGIVIFHFPLFLIMQVSL